MLIFIEKKYASYTGKYGTLENSVTMHEHMHPITAEHNR